MKLEIIYSKKMLKFLDKNPSVISENEVKNLIVLAVKKIILKKSSNIDLKRLKGKLKDFYRIRNGKVRIIFSIKEKNDNLCVVVNNIDYRGNVY